MFLTHTPISIKQLTWSSITEFTFDTCSKPYIPYTERNYKSNSNQSRFSAWFTEIEIYSFLTVPSILKDLLIKTPRTCNFSHSNVLWLPSCGTGRTPPINRPSHWLESGTRKLLSSFLPPLPWLYPLEWIGI